MNASFMHARIALLGLQLGVTSVWGELDGARMVVPLDGEWEVAQTMEAIQPAEYTAKAPVPGLVDMASPAFEAVGKPGELRKYFWYRRTFEAPAELPEFAQLKLHKAKYGTAVWINGEPLGEHLPSFTPSYWDLRPHLKAAAENELVIRVGAEREILPLGMPTGWDFEKQLYIPGIYDSVQLILCDPPYLTNVQCVPDIDAGRVRLLVELRGGANGGPCHVEAEIIEAGSGERVAQGRASSLDLLPAETRVLDLTLPIPNCRLWWPEDPFLYEVRLKSAGDSLGARFGMREFRVDPVTKRAVLNGQQRYLVGANVATYRFFEDALRGNKPWDREWVRSLHRQFKTLHWDTLRYCIGFPPDFWYAIADEEGFLIQDEFPIWTGWRDTRQHLQAGLIIPEYRAWMRERWNHPSVVIWDAQNESRISATGEALQAVRHLDYSNRPWDNGWAAPQGPCDVCESHPYFFSAGQGARKDLPVFRFGEMPGMDKVPRLHPAQKELDLPIIINEYDFLWITRAGEPTALTRHVYDHHLGPDATPAQRRMFHARGVATLTEFWRTNRTAMAVMHFCGLGYSRPGDQPPPEGGATSDAFVDLHTLKFEPLFEKYVRMAFNPVALLLDFWIEQVAPGSSHEVSVVVINDRQTLWQGDVRLRLDGQNEILDKAYCTVPPLGRQVVKLNFTAPQKAGRFILSAELSDGPHLIQSLRDVEAEKLPPPPGN